MFNIIKYSVCSTAINHCVCWLVKVWSFLVYLLFHFVNRWEKVHLVYNIYRLIIMQDSTWSYRVAFLAFPTPWCKCYEINLKKNNLFSSFLSQIDTGMLLWKYSHTEDSLMKLRKQHPHYPLAYWIRIYNTMWSKCITGMVYWGELGTVRWARTQAILTPRSL